jgi:ribosome-associated heat shock protein Hsp15
VGPNRTAAGRWQDDGVEEVRVDRWLWAVRVYKTRSIATEACRAGHVRLRGTAVKAAHPLKVGDVVEVRIDGWERRLEVIRTIDKRVGPVVAAECLVDHSAPRPPRELVPAPLFARLPASGRPTKRERRDLDRFRRR